MVLLGTIINGCCIIFGSFLGTFLHRIPERMKQTVMYAIGLSVMVLGLQMGLKSQNFLIVIISLVLGAIIGEVISLDDRLNTLGKWMEQKIGKKGTNSLSEGFVTATLIFVVGAMAILGALDSGIRGNHDILLMKAIIDGFTALVLTTSLGIGVMFSAIPVLLYEGTIALFATQINRLVPEPFMEQFIIEMTSAGGIMILALGLNLCGLTKIKVANLLPSILVVTIVVAILHGLSV
ncbi:DUF554 domain-containing protein [Aeribacillus pallidus]|jgi:uncharacterized protein|uniref:DUF554 domain-containing protein n=1 Tax=Aeribacillus pallidus TaxID=33936 RepID=UPI001D7FB8E4|nr:DUF554 domain-containing protein [Bacillus sp. (in: firmicutes)]